MHSNMNNEFHLLFWAFAFIQILDEEYLTATSKLTHTEQGVCGGGGACVHVCMCACTCVCM